jgi:hypothetical protein
MTVPAEQREVAQAELSNLSEASPKMRNLVRKIIKWLQFCLLQNVLFV